MKGGAPQFLSTFPGDNKKMQLAEKFAGPADRLRHILDKGPKFHNVYIIAMISCISGMMFGFDISSMSAFVGIKPYLTYFDSPSSEMQGLITAAMSLGSLFGSITSSIISEPFGRRPSLLICAFLWMVGAAIQLSLQNRAQLICGRIIAGWGVGFGSSVAPVYGSELAPRKHRGTVGGLFQFSVTLGILIMFYIGFGLGKIHGTASFRIAWGIQIIPGLFLFLGVFLIPESPRWLAKRGYWEDAERIVAETQAHGNREDPDVIIEMSEIKEQILVEEAGKNFKFIDLFNKKYRLRTFTAVMAQVWQQLTGMNVMMYYIVYIFEMAGYTGESANLVAGSIQYILNCVTTVPALYLMDKIGRRPLLIGGAIMMMAWQFAVGGILGQYSVPFPDSGSPSVTIKIPAEDGPAQKGVIACCYLFVCSFAMTWGVGIWLYCSEVWGDSASRQRGASLSTAANWAFNFAIAMYTPIGFQNISWKTYMIYATFCACMAVHVFFGFPETRGRRLEEIGQMWDEHVLPWKSGSWQPTVPILSDAELAAKMTQNNEEHIENADLMGSQQSTSEEEKEHEIAHKV